MKTAEEILIASVAKTLNLSPEESRRQFDEGMREDPEMICLIEAMKEYATEAIKADREKIKAEKEI